jgi:5-methyltetrahydrofolate--homocysteine methyltransferase
MHPIIEKLLINKKAIITDGAWGTQLQKKGLKPGDNPDSWNLTNPEAVKSVAAEYINAGSEIILTNTFGANRFVLSKFNLQDKVAEINKAGVLLSKKASGNKSLVFASMGPSGQLFFDRDEKMKQNLYAAFEEQAKAFESACADGIVIETMTNVKEASIAIAAAKSTKLPVIACAVFDSGRDKDRTIMGDTLEKIIEIFTNLGVDVIGTNCGQGINSFLPVCIRMRKLSGLPLWFKPNAGLPEFENGNTIYKADPGDFAKNAVELTKNGANFIGGCCGTSPEFIREISLLLKN